MSMDNQIAFLRATDTCVQRSVHPVSIEHSNSENLELPLNLDTQSPFRTLGYQCCSGSQCSRSSSVGSAVRLLQFYKQNLLCAQA